MKKRNWFWGIFFILAAILLIASGLGAFAAVSFWTVLGIVILVAIIIQSAIHRVWGGIFVAVAILYLILQSPLGWPYIAPWILIIAAIILAIGFHMIVKPKGKNGHCHGKDYSEYARNDGDDSGESPNINVRFTDATRYLRSDNLKNAYLGCSFGNLEVYFEEVTLDPAGAEVCVECKCGNVRLYMPKEWDINNQLQNSMGDVKFNRPCAPGEGAPRVKLVGGVNMGNIDVVLT